MNNSDDKAVAAEKDEADLYEIDQLTFDYFARCKFFDSPPLGDHYEDILAEMLRGVPHQVWKQCRTTPSNVCKM